MSESDKPRFRRVVRRAPSSSRGRLSWADFRPSELLGTLRAYFGLGRAAPPEPIVDPDTLARFIDARASFIAQTSLYGYLRTRAGQRYPEMFENDDFIVSINIAKWHMWLACLSDLSVYSGGLLARRSQLPDAQVQAFMLDLLDQTLARTGTPAEADAEFPEHALRVRSRVAMTPWHQVEDGEGPFHESPTALVRWAPVVKTFMAMDEEIVRNSVRFHWKEVRKELREQMVVEGLAGAVARY